MNIVRKIFRKLLWLLASIVLLVSILYACIHIPYIQTKITRYVANELAKATDLKVTIEGVDISLWNTVVLEDIKITTLNDSLILFAAEIGASIENIFLKEKSLILNNLALSESTIQFSKNKDGVWNIQKFLDKTKTKDPLKPSWKVTINAFEVKKSFFSYKNAESYTPQDFGINFSDLALQDLNFKVTAFYKDSASYTGSVHQLSAKDKSGFDLSNFSAHLFINDSLIAIKNALIYTPSSKIHIAKLDFEFNELNDFKDFTNKVTYNSNFKYSKIHFKDIAYFASNLQYTPYSFTISGKLKGKVKNFKGKDINIGYGLSSRFVGNFEVNGLPNIEQTFLYIDANDLHTTAKDIAQFRLPPFSKVKYINAPSIVSTIGTFDYTGNLTGFVNDFVAYGVLTTPIGIVDTDISFKESKGKADYVYSGKLSFLNFDLNRISTDKNIWGKTTFTTKITGEIKDKVFKTAVVQGDIEKIDILGYSYKNIEIDGLLAKQKFDGEILLNDKNINMSFKGLFDYSTEIPEFRFSTIVKNADLHALKINTDSISIVSFSSEVDFIGLQLDNLKGKIKIQNGTYTSKLGTHTSNGVLVDIDNIGSSRNISIKSDLIDITVNGKGLYKELPTYLFQYIQGHVPSLPQSFVSSSQTLSPQFNISVKIKKIDSLLHVIYPSIHIAENSYINAVFSTDDKLLVIDSKLPKLRIGNQEIENIQIYSEGNSKDMRSSVSFDLPQKDRTIHDISNILVVEKDSVKLSCLWQEKDSSLYSGDLYAKGHFGISQNKYLPSIFLSFSPSTIISADSVWQISKTNLLIDTSSYSIDNSLIKMKGQSIRISGKVSHNPEDVLIAEFNDYNISNFNNIINNKYIDIEGELRGKLSLQDYYNQQLIFANLDIPEFVFNNHIMGKMHISSKWISQEKGIAMNIGLTKGELEVIEAEGHYIPESKAIDYNLKLKYLRLADFEEIFAGTMDYFKGYADAELHISGTTKSPEFKGDLQLKRTKFKVNYTQAPYELKGALQAEGSKLLFKDIIIKDTLSNTGYVSGFFDLHDLKNPAYDLTISTDKILALNTTFKNNELFYGTSFYKGNARIQGDLFATKFTANGTTVGDTKFNIPLSYSELSENHDFLFFAKRDTSTQITNTPTITNIQESTTEVNINLNVTPAALCQIIFDEKVGDVIKVRGNANIQMLLNKQGDFTMFGDYIISDGDYLFTLKNLINKKFVIKPGGTIGWSGDPLDAQLNVSADYKIKASPKPLLADIVDSKTLASYSKKIPITCRVNLKNDLMAPDISYEILSTETSGQIGDIISSFDEDKKNVNFLSLLILNSFMSNNDNNTGGSVNSSIEVVTSQINQLLSQIDDDINVGVGVRTGDQTNANEFELAVSTQILNDRILVNLNGSTEFGQSGTTENTQTNDFDGNISVEVKMNEDGSFRLKGFSRSNTDPLNENQGNTQGIGLFFTREFNYLADLFKKKNK